MNRSEIDSFLPSVSIYWSTNCTKVGALCQTKEGRQPGRRTYKSESVKRAEKCPCAETHSREGRPGHKGEWQQFLLLTGLLTITYPVKEEAEINQTRMKSSSHLERGTKLSLFSGEGLSLRSQSARPESLVGESVREEPESAPVSPTRRRTIKNQAKALFISRWAWAFISSSFGVSDAAMG